MIFKLISTVFITVFALGCESSPPPAHVASAKTENPTQESVIVTKPGDENRPTIPKNLATASIAPSPALPLPVPALVGTGYFTILKSESASEQKPPCKDGLNCWDLNGNRVCDLATEDVTFDLRCTALDCQGPQGPIGPMGLQGAPGEQGPQGPEGPAGASCSQPFVASQIVYVNKAGDDINGDGSQCAPFLTITQALSAITDATTTKRYEINIGPGRYTEAPIHLKANVQLVGATNMLTVINSDVDIIDPSWAVLENNNLFTDHRAGFFNLTLLQNMTFNFAAANSFGGKLFFVNVNTNSTFVPVFTAASTSVNQVNVRSSEFVNGYTQNGINFMMFGSWVSGGNITINTQATTDTQVNLIGGGINIKTGQPGAGNIIVNSNPGDIPFSIFNLISFGLGGNNLGAGGQLIVTNNAQPLTIAATVDSIPIQSKVIISGTGTTTLRRIDDAFGLAYTPQVPADWSGSPPTTVQEALDRIAAVLSSIP